MNKWIKKNKNKVLMGVLIIISIIIGIFIMNFSLYETIIISIIIAFIFLIVGIANFADKQEKKAKKDRDKREKEIQAANKVKFDLDRNVYAIDLRKEELDTDDGKLIAKPKRTYKKRTKKVEVKK